MARVRRLLATVTVLVLLLGLIPGTVVGANVPQEKFLVGLLDTNAEAAVRAVGGAVERHSRKLGVAVASLPPARVADLRKDPRVSFVERDAKVWASQLTWADQFTWTDQLTWADQLTWVDQLTWADQFTWTDGTSVTSDWGVRAVGTPLAQKRGNLGQRVRVAVVDTGIDLTHPNLRVAGGTNILDPNASYSDDNGHGTHIAGIIGAQGLRGVTGVAPDASLYSVKVMGADGTGQISDVIAGLEWALTNKMQVVNLSLGSHAASRALEQALIRARTDGLVVVAASGNTGNTTGKGNTLEVPGRYPSVLTVGAVGPTLTRAVFSSTGKELDLVAPGVNILSTFPGGYRVGSGTSQSAAFASGVVALVLAANPGANPDDVEGILFRSAQPLTPSSSDWRYGHGLIRVPADQ